MDELALTCRVCGHEEHGEAPYAPVIKARMREHLSNSHPDHTEPFEILVHERQKGHDPSTTD